MPNTLEHGIARAGMVTGSVAHTIMRGNAKAWESLRRQLWADDGSAFATAVGGARGHGHAMEGITAAAFWERHPEYDIREAPFVPYMGRELLFVGKVGTSPDRFLYRNGRKVAGLECKSPLTVETFRKHLVDPARFRISAHYDQIQHSIFVTGLPRWWLAVRTDGHYEEHLFERDRVWQDYYKPRLVKFLEYMDGEDIGRRKKSARDIL